MSEAPERHPQIPEGARWVADLDRWEVGPRNERGEREGEFALYRSDDGTLYMRCRYAADRPEGPFEIFHPDGALAREGLYVDGEIDGLVVAYASDGPSPERLRGCCVPAGSARMQARYERGQLLREIFLDREGRVLLSDGTPRPERPATLPPEAEYDEFSRRWVVGASDRQIGALGTWRYYGQDGRLSEESDYEDGRKVGTRLFAADGGARLEAELTFDGTGEKRHGAWRRRFVADEDAEPSPYADARVREERGAFDREQPVGTWTLHDGAGAVLRVLERGRAFDEAEAQGLEVFGGERRPGAGWRELANGLRAAGRVREAICAAARAAAEAGDAEALRALLAEITEPLAPAECERVTQAALEASEAGVGALLSALVTGGEPAPLLRALASSSKGSTRAALDFVEASLLLVDRPMTHLTRALLRLEVGDDRGALDDAEAIGVESDETAQFVRDYARLLFPRWTFGPLEAPPEALAEAPNAEMPEGPGQPLDRIRAMVQIYATRLGQIREAVRRTRAEQGLADAEPAWLPPALTDLLPEGPVELRRFSATITDETEEGPETVEVQIDETLPLEGASVTALMRAARASWAALTWLCWSCGVDRVDLPDEVNPPAAFGAALAQTLHRVFRAQDALVTNGLRSMTAGVPGFVWEGMDIDEMPRPFAQMAYDELFEVRALFLWLVSPENLSPFQSDLRQV
jgi:antitoxin component YwqK of YwqJK toxin-antitoxin module